MQPDQTRQITAYGGDGAGFVPALAERRRCNLLARVGSAVGLGLLNSGAISKPILLTWFVAYVGLQFIEGPVFTLITCGRGSARRREILALVYLGINTLLFASLAVPLWLGPNWMGPAVAILMLVGAMGNASIMGRGMRPVFYVCSAPYFLLLIVGPALACWASHTFLQAALCIGPTIISFNAVSGYLTAESLRNAEAAAKAELEQKRAEAVAATEAKSSFVATVSHDLRTPLTAILACAGAIQRDARDAAETSRAAMISDAAKMMRCLLDDLLDLSKIEAGHMSVEITPFDPRNLLDDVARFWSEEAANKGLTLTVSVTDSLPPLAGGDTTRIRQILNNLLSNAVKFTESGGILIETMAEPIMEGGYAFTVSVVDTGAGLSDEQMARLFTRFEQAGPSVARTHGGTGLGLAISRQLARLMGGDLTVQSRTGEGARFTMECKLAAATESLPVKGADAMGQADAQDLHILVVDDHELNRRALTVLLEPLGVVPVLATSGEDALVILAHQVFDVVLMDLNMAGLDGRETTLRLRADEGPNRHVPVIAVTGAVEPLVLQSCLDSGMDAWVEKPLEPAALYGAIELVLARIDKAEAMAAA